MERKDVPGVVALVTDRKGVVYQAFGVADVPHMGGGNDVALFVVTPALHSRSCPDVINLRGRG